MTYVRDVVVIGAGIVGMAAATWLLRDGHHVTVIDPAPPGQGASFGNAGCLSPSSLVPLAGPGMLRQVPGWLLDAHGPLAVRWSYLPQVAPWLLRFLRAGSVAGVAHQAEALSRLLAPMWESFQALLGTAGAGHLLRRDGSLVVYRTQAAWLAAQGAWDLRRRHGIAWEELSAEALRAIDPALAPGLHRGILLRGNGHALDPQALVRHLADGFQRDGGTLVQAEATGFDIEAGRLRGVRTSQGRLPATAAVLAAGAHSRRLAAALGDRLPLETERGYHLTLKAPRIMPALPTMAAEDRFVATPMAMGLRLTGTVELAGLAAPPDWRHARKLLPLASRVFPGLAGEAAEAGSVWMGHRPSMPDSLPVIGPARLTRDVVHAFGHGHVGLMAAPFTGRLVAELIGGRAPATDLAAFSPARFRGGAA